MCFYYGYGTETDICQAYRYYLEADYSLRKRMENHERSGDKSLYSRVRKLLKEIRSDYMESMGEEYIFDPVFFDELIVSGRKVCMSYKKSKKGGYKLSFKLLPFPWEDSVPPFLETIPRENYCGLTGKIRVRTGKESKLHMPVKAKKIYFDMVSTDPLLDGMIIFELDHKVVATLNVDKIIRLAPKEDDVIEEVKERSFSMAMVRFKKGGKIYEYLADDLDIDAGDKVIVSSYDEETVVEVVDVVKKDESELTLRVSEYGHILKKV